MSRKAVGDLIGSEQATTLNTIQKLDLLDDNRADLLAEGSSGRHCRDSLALNARLERKGRCLVQDVMEPTFHH